MQRKYMLVLALLAIALPITADSSDPEKKPLQAQPEPRARGRIVISEPNRQGEIPPGLQRAVPQHTATTPQSAPPLPSELKGDRWEPLAIEAANEVARASVFAVGIGEYFRMGTHTGLRDGIEDETVGRQDYLLGEADGRLDPEAREDGVAIGRAAVGSQPRDDAEHRVVGQFKDLNHEPRNFPTARPPHYSPIIPAVDEPMPEELLEEFSLIETLPLPEARWQWLKNWQYDATQLYDIEAWEQIYNDSWGDPPAAFDLWVERYRGESVLSGLSLHDQLAFEDLFVAQFDAWLDVLYREVLVNAWQEGYDAGWSYGAFVREEWQYRVGYSHGYVRGALVGAESGFDEAYEAEYNQWYGEFFRDWSIHPKPTIEEFTLVGARDTGQLRAGDAVNVRFVVVNYGGAEGTLPLSLTGSILAEPVRSRLSVPRRSRVAPEPLKAILSPAAAGGRYEVEFTLDDHNRVLSLEVHPSFTGLTK